MAWAGQKKTVYAIDLEVVSEDRPGLLADLTQAIAGERSNIRRIEARSGDSEQSSIAISLEASDVKHLEKILGRLRNVPGVREVVRKYNVPADRGDRGDRGTA